jgi:hypothetical protein
VLGVRHLQAAPARMQEPGPRGRTGPPPPVRPA